MNSTEKIQLRESKLSFKLTVKKDLEYKIRTLCSNIPNTEWSGILFYRHKGDLDKGTFEVDCVDVFLMDIGSATFTEFETSPDIASYIADNLDLFDCQTGLIHSHNTMSTFFSGTDNSTLLEQGQENNHFLSLIVNNAGNYTAAITRKMVSEYTVNENLEYKSYGDKVVKSKHKAKGSRVFIDKINAEITVEGRYSFDDRIKEIKDSKAKPMPIAQQRSLFEDDDYYNNYSAFENKSRQKEGWQHGYYQNYGRNLLKTNKKEALEMYEDAFEYDVIMDILGVVDYDQIGKLESRYDEDGVSNQEFKEMALDSLNYYSANYNLDFKLMNDIVDLLPENRIVSTFKSIIADE